MKPLSWTSFNQPRHIGRLKRIYTQNVDGLHTHESLSYQNSAVVGHPKIAKDFVVECHGSLRRNDMVLYGCSDSLPQRFSDQISLDFEQENHKAALSQSESNQTVDLMLVFGTSLRVVPVCAIPNLVPSTATVYWSTVQLTMPPRTTTVEKRHSHQWQE
jgi:NAD-dependent SIR2 family protein deacetylase